MSREDWEGGTLKLSPAEYIKLKHALQNGVKKLYDDDFALAVKLHAALTEQKKGKRGFNLHEAFRAELRKSEVTRNSSTFGPTETFEYPFGMLEFEDVQRLVLRTHPRAVLRKPKRKDLLVVTPKTTSFEQEEMTIEFDDKACTVCYHSGTGNHQVEHARDLEIAGLFFELLGKVAWTEGTGGKLTGDDEYHEGRGGNNYVTARYGPLGKDEEATGALKK